MSVFPRTLVVIAIALTVTLPGLACGDDSSSGGDNPGNYLVPDYEKQMQKANDAADKAEQKQQEIEEELKQLEEGP